MAFFRMPQLATKLVLLGALLATSTAKYTPEDMLQVARRGVAEPNPAGTYALYTVSTYSFDKHKTTSELRVLNIADGTSWQFTNQSIGEAHWLGDGNKIVWLQYEDDGNTSFAIGDATKPTAEPVIAGSVPGAAEGVKLAEIGKDLLAVSFIGKANPNGTLYNAELAVKPRSSGLAYTTLFVRHWDSYVTPQRNAIFYTTLTKLNETSYTIGETYNALNGTGLESPIAPFGGTDNYDLSSNGIAFVAKDPKLTFGKLNQASTKKSSLYYIPLKSFQEIPPQGVEILTPGLEGDTAIPTFSYSGKHIAFAKQREINYESDKWRPFVVEFGKTTTATEYFKSADGKGSWDRWALNIKWSADDKDLYVAAEDYARTRLFTFPADPSQASSQPALIKAEGSVVDYWLLSAKSKTNELLVSSSSLIDNSLYEIVTPSIAAASNATKGIKQVSSNTNNGANFGISRSQYSEVWFKGAGDYNVHAWIIRPSWFKEGETYPLAFIIHGGPQGTHADGWSNRWNVVLYAEQGYVVFLPDPTGSTSYGQDLIDGIQGQWGGRPYDDLVNGFNYIENNLKYVDTNRSVALGASYGGYMTFWIQGHDLGRKFKAIFSHDGSFNTIAQYTSEELWFMQHDFNGTLWDNYENYERWNPAAHTQNWATPHLIVHNERDYRLPIAEGLAAFNVLQTRGVESKFLTFPDENHWVLNRENSLVWHKTVLDFLNPKVGLPPYSTPDDVEYRATLQNGEWI